MTTAMTQERETENWRKLYVNSQCELSFQVKRSRNRLINFDRYKHLRNLQGVTIPKLYGYGHMWRMFYAIILEFCDGGTPNPSSQADMEGTRKALEQLHDNHVLHGDLASQRPPWKRANY